MDEFTNDFRSEVGWMSGIDNSPDPSLTVPSGKVLSVEPQCERIHANKMLRDAQ